MSKSKKLDALLALGIILLVSALVWHKARAEAAPVVITPASCPAAQVGVFYMCQMTATGGVPPYKWTMPALATFETQYPGLQWKVTGENNSILEIWGVPQEPNDGESLLPHPPSSVKEN